MCHIASGRAWGWRGLKGPSSEGYASQVEIQVPWDVKGVRLPRSSQHQGQRETGTQSHAKLRATKSWLRIRSSSFEFRAVSLFGARTALASTRTVRR